MSADTTRRRSTARRPSAPARARAPIALAPPPDLRHPAFLTAALVAAACVVVGVTYKMNDSDMWQHFAVGRAIWTLHEIPKTQLWTWPTYGAPDVNASWGFRVLIWPIWHAFGIWGLFAWRWATTLAAFGLLWSAARKMGARGLTPLIVTVLCSLVYRQRSQIRPETLVAVLLAAELWILESWRAAARAWEESGVAPRDHRPWLLLIALVWANVHISYWLGLVVQFFYFVGAPGSSRAPGAAWLERIGLAGWKIPAAIGLGSGLISFVNPWGWLALWQPFDYYLNWRHEDIFKNIGELTPINWSFNSRNGLAELLAGWILLQIWRAFMRRLDVVELLLFGLLTAQAFPSQRFLGFFALVAAMFVSRDLDEFARSRSYLPSWKLRGFGARAAATALACVAIGIPEWSRLSFPLGVGYFGWGPPVRACDFIEQHGLHGRVFNQFAAGGYLVYRFWPDRSRLPFIDIHQAGTREDRYIYAHAVADSAAWHYLDRKYRFDYVIHFTFQNPGDHLIDYLDADSAHWALVSTDDAAGLYLRRDGSGAALVPAYEYHDVPGGHARQLEVLARCETDTALRRATELELRRAIADSPFHARAQTMLAQLRLMDGAIAEARALLVDATRRNPYERRAHAFLGQVELAMGQPREARRDFQREIDLMGEDAYLARGVARSLARTGDRSGAKRWYRRAISHDPNDQASRDSLAALDGARP